MAKQPTFGEELEKFKAYLKSDANEDAKRPLLYPLFQKLFKEKFRIESEANGADVYVEGALLVEAKTAHSQWLDGFFQALHYQKKFGLAYNTIMVVAKGFVGIWRVDKLPETAVILAHTADPLKAPNFIGKENARKTQPALRRDIQAAALYWLEPKDLTGDIFAGARNLTTETFEVLKILRNLDSDRLQINTHNFIHTIERMKPFFGQAIEAVHAFYSIVAFWDITATVALDDNGMEPRVIGFKGQKFSDAIAVPPRQVQAFKKFVEGQYVFTNEGSGLTVDYYFSRFDEVLAIIDPEYVKQHGIFFTNDNLSRFSLWYVKRLLGEQIGENYIVFDPAGGSGNLISAWRGKLRHKIISELQPDLLKTIEKRMKADPFHLQSGFTIIPKTIENKGLNFLDRAAADYWQDLEKALQAKNLALDKPIAFLLNPPYKNTDENQAARELKEAHYQLHPSITELTGEDAAKERYLAFLGQILNLAQHQHGLQAQNQALVLIFTPTSWLIPRPTYQRFRELWDAHFEYLSGMIVTSNEWFKLDGKWPLAFTLWQYRAESLPPGLHNQVRLLDLCHLSRPDLNLNWNDPDESLEILLGPILESAQTVVFDHKKAAIKNMLNQKMYDFKRDPSKEELALWKNSRKIYGGLPLNDERRNNKKTYGIPDGEFIGFMDDNTPVRIKQDSDQRHSQKPQRVWFRLDSPFKDINKTKCFNGATDNRSYCAYDLASAQATFTWFCITKVLNGRYPLWANQYDIWSPALGEALAGEWYGLCFAYVLAENRCVVTKFEADNPVAGAPEVFVDNPLCPTHPDNFWGRVLQPFLAGTPQAGLAQDLVAAVEALYLYWNAHYCRGEYLHHVGLQDEAYFRYFSYADFLTPHSGLIQIRKYAEQEGAADLLEHFAHIAELTKAVRARLYVLLVEEMGYFG